MLRNGLVLQTAVLSVNTTASVRLSAARAKIPRQAEPSIMLAMPVARKMVVRSNVSNSTGAPSSPTQYLK